MKEKWTEIGRIFAKFKGLTTIGAATAISNGMGAVFWFVMASLLGTDLYGKVSYLIAIAIISSRISLVGSANTLMVYVPKGVKIQPPTYLIAIITSIVTSLIVFFVFLNDIGVSVYIIGFVIFTLITSDLLGRKEYREYAKYLISQKILLIALAVLLFYIIGFNGVILGIAISFLPYIYKISKDFKNVKLDFSLLRTRAGFVMNSYLLDLTNAFNGSLDKLIIAPLLGFTLLGNYQLGIQFLAVLTIVPGIVYQYTLPHDASGNQNKPLKKLTIVYSIILAALSIVLAPLILPILFPKFDEAIEIIQIISVTIIPATVVMTYISKFLGAGQSKIVLVGSGIYLAIQIPSIVILGNIFGVNGAALAIVIGNIAQALYYIMVDRFYQKGHRLEP